ncbi:MAG: exosome complex component RRP45 [Asgard group archaeon]|nr:exosome complex component RRP45 [Asgard group archaeon]
MSKEISNNQKNYLFEALKNNIRLSNRKFDELRSIDIKLSDSKYGYVELTWGSTKLIVNISARIIEPYKDRPFEGIFTINCELPNNLKSEEIIDENLLSRTLEKSIRRSNSLDLENLCIIAGEKVWEIIIDLNYLNYDGNLIDSGCLAIMIGLLDFKKNDISVTSNGGIKIFDLDERQPIELSILHIPICLTFLFFNLGSKEMNLKSDEINEIYLLDADSLEEYCRDGFLTITLNQNRDLIQLNKNGGLPIDAQQLLQLCHNSMEIIDKLTNLIKTTVKTHQEKRYKLQNFKLLEASADR